MKIAGSHKQSTRNHTFYNLDVLESRAYYTYTVYQYISIWAELLRDNEKVKITNSRQFYKYLI